MWFIDLTVRSKTTEARVGSISSRGVGWKESMSCVHIICDGNRTYSIMKGHLKDIETYAYDEAWKKLEDVTRFIFDNSRVRYIFFTVTARRNHLDPKRAESVRPTATLLPNHLARTLEYYKRKRARVKFIGDNALFARTSAEPEKTARTMELLERETSGFEDRFVFHQVAYDSVYEYVKVFKRTLARKEWSRMGSMAFERTARELGERYYGTHVPEVDVCVRTMRCRLSNTLPILVGEYADFYFFPGPFPMIQTGHLERIFEDYYLRRESKGGTFVYDREDIRALQKFRMDDFDLNPFFIGSRAAKVWLPIGKRDVKASPSRSDKYDRPTSVSYKLQRLE